MSSSFSCTDGIIKEFEKKYEENFNNEQYNWESFLSKEKARRIKNISIRRQTEGLYLAKCDEVFVFYFYVFMCVCVCVCVFYLFIYLFIFFLSYSL